MPEPITLLSITSSLIVEIGKGILGNRSDATFCKSVTSIYRKLNNNLSEPINHDILKAVRRAQLNSTLIACKYILATKYKLWDKLYSQAPENLREVCRYLRSELKKLDKNNFKFEQNEFSKNPSLLVIAQNNSLEEHLKKVVFKHKNLIINELKEAELNWVETDLQTIILNGWNENERKVDWYDLMCGFFAEELKTNPRLSAILQTEYIVNIQQDFNELNVSISLFEERLDMYFNTQVKILNDIKNIYRIIDINTQLILDEVQSEGNKTRILIEEFRKELKKELEEQKKAQQRGENKNPYAKYVDALVDFFEGVKENEPLNIEIAVDKKCMIVIYHTHNPNIEFKRIEFFSEENHLVFLTEQYKRRPLGMEIAEPIAKCLRRANRVYMVKTNKEFKPESSFELPLKVY